MISYRGDHGVDFFHSNFSLGYLSKLTLTRIHARNALLALTSTSALFAFLWMGFLLLPLFGFASILGVNRVSEPA
jgi:hypothetical protein